MKRLHVLTVFVLIVVAGLLTAVAQETKKPFVPIQDELLWKPDPADWLSWRRTLDGQHPQSPTEIGTWFQQTAKAWNRHPTPFLWNGKRRQRRRKQRGDAHPLGGSGAHTKQPLSSPGTVPKNGTARGK